MASGITVDRLAEAKGLPSQVLRSFGVQDEPSGVRIPYVTPDGGPARSRHRKAVGGSANSWWDDADLPMTAYWHPVVPEFVRRRGALLVVEGESSCWAAWHGGFGAVGIPGSDEVDLLRPEHLGAAPLVVIVVEPDDPDTYPAGVAYYTGRLREHLQRIGYRGQVAQLSLDGVAEDLPALHRADSAAFATRLGSLVAEAATTVVRL